MIVTAALKECIQCAESRAAFGRAPRRGHMRFHVSLGGSEQQDMLDCNDPIQ